MSVPTRSSRGTRLLFLDDSGHPAPSHASRAVVIGGIAVASNDVFALDRRIAGTKAHRFPERGDPAGWEIKATDTIRPNAWRRKRNRTLVEGIMGILQGLDCTVYTVSISKSNMHHVMNQRTTMPLQLQALAEHFATECMHRNEIGLMVMDRSSHRVDSHASHCVASYVIPRRMPLHPTVYYADSTTSSAIQAADLIAGVRRRSIEGDPNTQVLDRQFTELHPIGTTELRTREGRRWSNRIALF